MTDYTPMDDSRVAAVLAAASAPAEGPLPGEAEALKVFRSVHQPRRRFHLMSRKSENAKLVAAAIFGGAVVLSGAAAAATGALPVGHGHSSSHAPKSHTPDANDSSDDAGTSQDSTDTTTGSASTLDQNQGKGSEISQLANTTLAGQQHKGKTICIVASDGHCHAAQSGTTAHGQSGTTHGQAGTTHGQAGTTHGQAGTTHGQAGTTHGQAGTTHGQAGTTHGQAGTTHGQAGTTHGQAGTTHGQAGTS